MSLFLLKIKYLNLFFILPFFVNENDLSYIDDDVIFIFM